MARNAAATKRQILESAYALFYQKGFGRVGVDEIAEAAQITKRTLYYHFASKDDLLAEVLELHHELAMTRIQRFEHEYSGSAEERVARLFTALAEWSSKPGWTASGFTRLAMELADLPGHPARVIGRRHKRDVESWYAELLANAGIADAAELGRALALLAEGACVLVLIHGDRSYAESAKKIAISLVRAARGKRRRPTKRK
jgi:AcrR family transcriptional regulator